MSTTVRQGEANVSQQVRQGVRQGKTSKELKEEKRQALLRLKHGNDEEGGILSEDDFKMEVPMKTEKVSGLPAPKIKNLLEEDDIDTGNFMTEIYEPEINVGREIKVQEISEDTMMEIAKTEIKFLTQEISTLRKEIFDHKDKARIQDLESEISRSELAKAKEEISDLKIKVKIANAGVVKDLEISSQEISDLKSVICAQNAAKAEVSAELETAKQEISDIRKNVLTVEAAEAEVIKDLEISKKEISDLKQQISAVDMVPAENMEICGKEISDLQAALNKSVKESEILRSEISYIRSMLSQDDRVMDAPQGESEIYTFILEKRKLQADLRKSQEEISRLSLELAQRPSLSRVLAPLLNCVWTRRQDDATLLRNYQNF